MGADFMAGGRRVCAVCRDELAAEAAAALAPERIRGPQPMICEWCREPFEALRISAKFCSSSCRYASWDAGRKAAKAARGSGSAAA
jgi:hypothetical protein